MFWYICVYHNIFIYINSFFLILFSSYIIFLSNSIVRKNRTTIFSIIYFAIVNCVSLCVSHSCPLCCPQTGQQHFKTTPFFKFNCTHFVYNKNNVVVFYIVSVLLYYFSFNCLFVSLYLTPIAFSLVIALLPV